MEKKITLKILIMFAWITNEVLAKISNSIEELEEKVTGYEIYSDNTQLNVCDIENKNSLKLFCQCDAKDIDTAKILTCKISEFAGQGSIWDSFKLQSQIIKLDITSRIPSKTAVNVIPRLALSYLKNLQSLEIRFGNIDSIESFAFERLRLLQYICLKKNGIKTIDRYSFVELESLKSLFLNINKLKELDRDMFLGVPSLSKLYMDRNELVYLGKGTFRNLQNLEVLDLYSNELEFITKDTFAGLSSLKRLDLRNNSINYIEQEAFLDTCELEELRLDGNDLEHISDGMFDGMPALKHLGLSRNRLQDISSNAFNTMPRLELLNLSSNILPSLSFEAMKPLMENFKKSTFRLYLQDNLLVCHCRISWLHVLLDDNNNTLMHDMLRDLKCLLKTNNTENAQAGDKIIKRRLFIYQKFGLYKYLKPGYNFTRFHDIPILDLPCHTKLNSTISSTAAKGQDYSELRYEYYLLLFLILTFA